MPFNLNEPQNGNIVDADLLRAQFNALNNDKLPTLEKGAANGVASLESNSPTSIPDFPKSVVTSVCVLENGTPSLCNGPPGFSIVCHITGTSTRPRESSMG